MVLQAFLALFGEQLQLVLSEGVVLVVYLTLSDLLVPLDLALVLVTLASIVCRVLVFVEHFDLLLELSLVLHPVFLDLALE